MVARREIRKSPSAMARWLGELRSRVRSRILSPSARGFALHIVVPALLAQLFFVLTIFQILIPSVERQLIDRKQEMIRELTASAWSILDEYRQEEVAGRLTREEAQREAAARIEFLRYGEDGEDYFWVTDTHPRMIVHPYRRDLNGQDLSDFEDEKGKKLFVAFVDAVRDRDADYVEYYWQWKNDPNRIVPKLSYVRVFAPWEWIIGTGIYTEDVREEIVRIRTNLSLISLGIVSTISLLLLYIARQSFAIERRRGLAEAALQESHERYRALVEASTEGTLMIVEGKCAYSNRTLLDMLGYEAEELASLGIESLPVAETEDDRRALDWIRALLLGEPVPEQLEARLRHKDGRAVRCLLNATRIDVAGRAGFILIVRDVTSHKEMQAALDQTSRQLEMLSSAISLGILRSTWGRGTTLVEANPAARRLFGLAPDGELADFDWLTRVADPAERDAFTASLSAAGVLADYRLGLLLADGSRIEVSLFAALVGDPNGQSRHCDVVIQDVTERRRADAERDDLIAQLQASSFFLQGPVAGALRPALTCPTSLSIARAASLVARSPAKAVLVAEAGGELVGIVTDHDFRERVVAAGLDAGRPVREIMTAPVVAISEHALVYEAILKMQALSPASAAQALPPASGGAQPNDHQMAHLLGSETGNAIDHLVVKDDAGDVKGIVRYRDLVNFRQHSSVILTSQIRNARSVDEIREGHQSLPRLVKALIDSGTRVRHVNRTITNTSDGIVERLLALAIERLGPPPARFAFLVLGSEGRGEQTLLTDQDNALVYADPEPEAAKECANYFLALGTLVCDWLDEVGYAYCQGGVMAKNPRWNRPLSGWRKQFADWIATPDPQEILDVNVAFDFRAVGGDASLARDLREWVFGQVAAHPPFLLHFAQNALLYRPPLGIFGNIVVGQSGEGAKALSLKEAMMPVVSYSRLYALKHRIEQTHTLDRLRTLRERGLLSREASDELAPAYESLMRLRLDRQAIALRENRPPSNSISPREWTSMDEAMLKRAFAATANLRRKISYDFLGTA